MDRRRALPARGPAADAVHHRRRLDRRRASSSSCRRCWRALEANFIKRVLTSQPHIQLLPPDQVARPLRGDAAGELEDADVQRPSQRMLSIDQWPKIRDQLLAMPEVTAVSPTMSGSALAVRGDASRAITLVRASNPESYFKIVRVPDYIVAGEPRLTSDDIIIGTELAKDLGATVGDKLNVSAANGATRVLTITGLVDLGNKGANQRTAYVALRTAQSLLGMIGGVTTIDLTVHDIYAAEDARAANPGGDRRRGRQLDQDQRAILHRGQGAEDLEHADPCLSSPYRWPSASPRCWSSRSSSARRTSASCARWARRAARSCACSCCKAALLGFAGSLFGSAMGAAALIYWHAVARQVDGSELFPLILDRQLFICGGDPRDPDRACSPPWRRRCAPPGSIRWWRSVAEDILRLDKICKSYNVGLPSETEVLHDIDLDHAPGRIPRADGPVRAPARARCSTSSACSIGRRRAGCSSRATTPARCRKPRSRTCADTASASCSSITT